MNRFNLEIQNLTIAFGEQVLFSNLSLSVKAGERVCLRGPSGSGKSTLFRCLLGLHIPQSGHILIQGEPLSPATVWKLRQQIAWVPQGPDWGHTPVRNVLQRPFNFKMNHELRGALDNLPILLEQFGLPDSLLNKRADSLSGGEKQRLAIVSALLLNRPILLLDEVTSALDADNRERVSEWIMNEKRSILAISHDAGSGTWSDRTLDLETGDA